MIGTRYIEHNGVWVPEYTVGDGLGTRIARGLYKLGFEQKPGCGCNKRQRSLDKFSDAIQQGLRIPKPISGGSPGLFFEEDYENAGEYGSVVPPACPNWNPCVAADGTTHSGTHSLRGAYTLPCGDSTAIINGQPSLGCGFDPWDHGFTPTPDVWTRAWYRTHNLNYDTVDSKHFHLGDLTNYPNCWLETDASSFAARKLMFACQGCADANYDDCLYYGNIATFNDQWYCLETHIRMNTPGVRDGVVEIYIDGNLSLSSGGVALRGPNNINPAGCNPATTACNRNFTQFSNLRHYVQFALPAAGGTAFLYFDQFAVGDTRIGCAGGGGDTTPPTIQITGPTSNPTYLTRTSPL